MCASSYRDQQICYVNGNILSWSVSFSSGDVLIAENCAILVICRGPHGILDMPCENMQWTQEYSPCLCLYRALYAVFVIPADGNRQRLEVHRHRKSFVGSRAHRAVTAGVTICKSALMVIRTHCVYPMGFNERLL